jgi:hypothetical protein
MVEECIHDMPIEWCAICGRSRHGSGFSAPNPSRRGNATPNRTKQDALTRLCGLLGLAPLKIGVGSSIPSVLFDELVRRFGVPPGSMPEVAEAVARMANVPWDENCDSRHTVSGGGSTVTAVGLNRLAEAVDRLV